MTKRDSTIERRKSAWGENPDYRIDIETCDKPVRVVFNGETIADSQHTLLLQEQDHAPVYYFPREDVHMDRLKPTTKTTVCPFKGEASHWSLTVGGRHIEVAAWGYEDPFDEVNKIKGYIAFYPEAGDLIS